MRITADTNILVRALVRDDPRQAALAANLLRQAELVAVPVPALCELVWVLRRVYGFGQDDIHAAMTALLNAANVTTHRAAAEAGLAMLAAGGDFADGVMAFEGKWLGGEVFVSFDRKAVALLKGLGVAAEEK